MNDKLLENAVQEIASNHRKIINDWCKAYLAQIYQEKGSINPGDFILYEQEPSIQETLRGNIFCKMYWFEPKDTE